MKNTNGGTPAFATSAGDKGMTKRELISAKLMAFALAKVPFSLENDKETDKKITEAAQVAIKATDILLSELEK